MLTIIGKVHHDQLDETQAPEWVKDLIRKVCEDFCVPMPFFFVWRKIRYSTEHHKRSVTGACWFNYWDVKTHTGGSRISIRVGTLASEKEIRYVVLHELAHHVRNVIDGYCCSHAVRFWDTCFRQSGSCTTQKGDSHHATPDSRYEHQHARHATVYSRTRPVSSM